jgi:hypothetical protein
MDNSIILKNNETDVKNNKKQYDKEYSKQFFQKNKERKYYCDLCNCEVSFFNQSHHKSSKKHKLLIEKDTYIKLLDEKEQQIKILEEKDKYIKLLEEKELYIKKLREREQSIREFELKYEKK